MATEYTYTKVADVERLTLEVNTSAIPVVLEYINLNGSALSLFFKIALSLGDKAVLDGIVAAHVSTPLASEPQEVKAFPSYASDGTPYVYASPRPLGHYSYFSSSGDTADEVGAAPRIQFNMTASDSSKTLDLTFNEDVYLKDGLIMPRNAPFGAAVDIEVVHPLAGRILYFGKDVPVLGSYPANLNTEDRALIPKGMIVRITLHNASGIEGEDAPAAFAMAGRLELYRPMPEIEM